MSRQRDGKEKTPFGPDAETAECLRWMAVWSTRAPNLSGRVIKAETHWREKF